MNAECVICYDANCKYFKSSFCHHITCMNCYKKLNKKICPICRKMLQNFNIVIKYAVIVKMINLII